MSGVRCPRPGCNGRLDKALESRPAKRENSIRRRRECSVCGCRATTYERIVLDPQAQVEADAAIAEAESQLEDIQQMWQYLSRENRKAIHAFASVLYSSTSID